MAKKISSFSEDVVMDIDYTAPVKYSRIVCSAMPTGAATIRNPAPSGVGQLSKDYNDAHLYASGVYLQFNTRFDDKTYYTA